MAAPLLKLNNGTPLKFNDQLQNEASADTWISFNKLGQSNLLQQNRPMLQVLCSISLELHRPERSMQENVFLLSSFCSCASPILEQGGDS